MSINKSKTLPKINSSLSQLKNVKVLTFCGMMGALAIVLNYVATIRIGQYIRIGFSGLPNQVVDYLFGPWIGALFGAVMDFLKWFLSNDGDFYFGFTITAMVSAVIYGLFLYKRPLKVSNVILSQLCVKIFCNIGLNTLWLKMYHGQAFGAILPARIVSNAVMLPIDCVIMYMILTAVNKTIRPYFLY